MASKPISQLDAIPDLEGADLLAIVDDSELDTNVKTKKVSISQLDARATASNQGASGEGVFIGKNGPEFQFRKITGSSTVTVSLDGSAIKLEAVGESNQASNIGTGEGSSFAGKVGEILQFKKLKAQGAILISETADTITIETSAAVGEANTASNQGTGQAVFKQKSLADLEFYTIEGLGDLEVNLVGDNIQLGVPQLRIDVDQAQSDADAAQATADAHASRHLPSGADPLASASAVQLSADSMNTEGSAESFARSDHTHDMETGAASGLDGDSTNQEGSGSPLARADHSHNIATGAPSTQTPDNANSEGTSPNLARADHVHNIPAATPGSIQPDHPAQEGGAASFARSDHQHAIATEAPANNLDGDSTNTEGSATSFARSDHEHAINTGTPSTQTPDQANAEGSAAALARVDHVHNIPTESAGEITDTTNSEGVAASFARSDHGHAHGDRGGGSLHAVASNTVNGFMAALDKVKASNVMNTGLLEGGALSIGAPTSTFSISDGSGRVVDNHSDPSNPVVTEVSWSGLTNQAITNLATAERSYIGINSAGAVVQQVSEFTAIQKRDIIDLGVLLHEDNATVSDAVSSPDYVFDVAGLLRDFLSTQGPFNVSGNIYFANGANLNINKSAGSTFGPGINAATPKNPNFVTDPLVTAGAMAYVYEDGSGDFTIESEVASVTPNRKDDGSGTPTTYGNNRWGVSRIYWLPLLNKTFIQLPKEDYNSSSNAIANIGTDNFNPFVKSGDPINLRGYLVVRGGATDLSDESDAIFIEASEGEKILGSGEQGIAGEPNTASNQNSAGVGVFKQKVGVDLEFKGINNTDGFLGISEDVPSNEIRIAANTASAEGLDGDTTNGEGTNSTLARSDHSHAIATGTPSSQTPDQANAEGSAAALARADHVHNIPAGAAVQIGGNSTNQEGVAASFARSDHTHSINTGTPSTQTPDQANAEGTSDEMARADHVHNIPAGTPGTITPDSSAAEGSAASFARSDHQHAIAAAAPSTNLSATTANQEGSSSSFSRADHVHNIDTGVAVTLQANSTNTEGTSANLARADHTHDLATGAASSQTPAQANAEGSSINLARADHVHNIPVGVPSTIGSANAEGSAAAFARQDHVHDHGNQGGGTTHAAVTQSVNGFMSSTDKTKLDEMILAWLQYGTSVQQDTSGAGGNLVLDFADNLNSRPNGVLNKLAVDQFEVLQAMEVEVSFNLDVDSSGNNVGGEAYVSVNNTRQDETTVRFNTRGNSSESVCATLPPMILSLAADDVVRFVLNGREGGNTLSLEQNNDGVSWAKVKVLRLL